MGDNHIDAVYHTLLNLGYAKKKAHTAAVKCITKLTEESAVKKREKACTAS